MTHGNRHSAQEETTFSSLDLDNFTESGSPTDVEKFARLHNLSLGIGSSFTLEEALWTLYQECSVFLDTTNFAIALYDQADEAIQVVVLYDRGNQQQPLRIPFEAQQKGLIQRVLTSRQQLLIEDLPALGDVSLELTPYLSRETPIRSWIGVPIPNPIHMGQTASHALGMLTLWSDQPQAFTQNDLWLLWAIARQCAVSLRHVQLFESLHQRALEIAIINNIGQQLGSTLDLQTVIRQLMTQLRHLFNVQAGALFLRDVVTDSLVFQAALTTDHSSPERFVIPAGEGIAGQVVKTGEAMLIPRISDADEFAVHEAVQEHLSLAPRSLMCAPLRVREQVIGVVQLFNKHDGEFTRRELDLLGALASYSGMAIANARLYQSVLAERDRVIDAEDNARKELARHLHDGPTQLVSDVLSRLNFCQEAVTREPELVPEELDKMQQIADQAIHQMRTMLFELRPLVLEAEGLATALEVFIERRRREIKDGPRLTLKQRTHQPDGQFSRLEEKIESAMFSVVQEAVNNAIKHAKAKNVIVQFTEVPDAFYIVIVDDGQGFKVSDVLDNYSRRASMGMVNLRERAELIGGELTIKSSPGMGTHIFLFVPKEASLREHNRLVTGLLQIPLHLPPVEEL